jgi:integrase/recombinase XerC
LAESTATSGELAVLRFRDLDLKHSRVWITGSARRSARWGYIEAWGREQLEQRVRSVDGDADTQIVYRGCEGGASGGASTSQALRWTLIRAGLGVDPRVKPASIRAWAGRRMAERGLSIDEIALRLGMGSLDRTAAFVGWMGGIRS